MTATAAPLRQHEPRLRFPGIVRSEAIKLRTLRSTWWCAGVLVVVAALMGLLISAVLPTGERLPPAQQEALAVQVLTLGALLTQLVAAVLGVLVISGEYGTGMIRSTFAAVPQRLPALAAKLVVLALGVLAVGLISTALTALVAAPVLAARGIGLPATAALWLPVLGSSVYLVLVAVLAFAIGALLRSTAGGIATVVGLLLVAPIVLNLAVAISRADWLQTVAALLPSNAGAELYHYATPGGPGLGGSSGLVLDGWGGFGVLLAWVAVFLVPAVVAVRRRDV